MPGSAHETRGHLGRRRGAALRHPGTGMFAPEVLGPTVDRLAELAGGGRALELAIGTGRVGVPLAERGVPVTGIELSRPWSTSCAPRSTRTRSRCVVGDMATATRARRVHARLPRLQHDLQPADPGRAGRVLPQRRPPPRARAAGSSSSCGCPSCARSRRAARPPSGTASPATSLLDTYDVLHQQVRVAPLHVRRRAGRPQLGRSPHRYIWPAELDLMAPAGRVRAGEPARRLVRRGVHRRLPVARVGLPVARLSRGLGRLDSWRTDRPRT